MNDVPKAEREMVARARHALHRLSGPLLGDALADQLWDARKGLYEPQRKG